MQDRLNHNDVTNRVNVEDPRQVRETIAALFGARYPGVHFGALARAFDDFAALFEGRFPGYLPCDTLYHDVRHTLDMTLATARLIDGHERVCPPEERLGARRATLGVLVALLHDTGYLKKSSRGAGGERRRLHQGARQPQRRVRRGLPAAARLRRRGAARGSAWCISPATRWTSTTSRSTIRATACSAGWSARPT